MNSSKNNRSPQKKTNGSFATVIETREFAGEQASGLLMVRTKRTQALLDEINDCDTIASTLTQYHRGNRLAGRLRKGQRKKTEEFRQYWNEAFQDGKQLRTWTDHLGHRTLDQLRIKKFAASTRHDSAAPDLKSAAAA